jgi:hypothetical protein
MSSGSLRLSVPDLGDSLNAGSCWLPIRCLTDWVSRRAARKDIDEDGLALRCPLSIIQVVEVPAQALIEDVGAAEGKRAIVAGREATSEDGSSLGRGIELELEVGSNISRAALCVMQLAVGQSDDQTSRVTTSTLDGCQYAVVSIQVGCGAHLVDITLHHIAVHSCDLEAPGVVCRATRRCGGAGSDIASLWESIGHGGQSSESERGLHV